MKGHRLFAELVIALLAAPAASPFADGRLFEGVGRPPHHHHRGNERRLREAEGAGGGSGGGAGEAAARRPHAAAEGGGPWLPPPMVPGNHAEQWAPACAFGAELRAAALASEARRPPAAYPFWTAADASLSRSAVPTRVAPIIRSSSQGFTWFEDEKKPGFVARNPGASLRLRVGPHRGLALLGALRSSQRAMGRAVVRGRGRCAAEPIDDPGAAPRAPQEEAALAAAVAGAAGAGSWGGAVLLDGSWGEREFDGAGVSILYTWRGAPPAPHQPPHCCLSTSESCDKKALNSSSPAAAAQAHRAPHCVRGCVRGVRAAACDHPGAGGAVAGDALAA